MVRPRSGTKSESTMDKPIDPSEAAKTLGRLGGLKGGKARAEKLTPEKRREIAKKAIEARWAKVRENQPVSQAKIPEEICSGVLSIAGIDMPCAVVENVSNPDHPIRLFSQEGFLKAIGRAGKAKGGQGSSVVDGPPPFLAANNLKPFIPEHLTWSTVPIIYKPQKAPRAFGFRAELLYEVCWVYIDALKAGVLDRYPTQIQIAENCEILVRGLGVIGIVALVDEATGFQEIRAKDELQRLIDQIIEKYVLPERIRRKAKFTEEFFREVYRLHGWPYKPGNAKHTPLLGKIINKYIYGVFPPCVPQEIRVRNPIRENGYRRDKNYWWLTDEGIPLLEKQIEIVTLFMRGARDKEQFEESFERAFAKEFQERLPLTIDITPEDEAAKPKRKK